MVPLKLTGFFTAAQHSAEVHPSDHPSVGAAEFELVVGNSLSASLGQLLLAQLRKSNLTIGLTGFH